MFKAGLARRIITPHTSMPMAGFAARQGSSRGKLHDLWTKALALQDENGSHAVIITTDILYLTEEICEAVAREIHDRHGLERKSLIFNASHTHSGPMVSHPALGVCELDESQLREIEAYTRRLTSELIEVISESLGNFQVAKLRYALSKAGFAVNRREVTSQGIINGYNPTGPTDHDVPVLRVESHQGQLLAVVFGYACHTTSLTAGNLLFSGDYAGFAQLELETKYPGAQAMFLMLCGADQNALPRGSIELSQKYGTQLAQAVGAAVEQPGENLYGEIQTVYERINLELEPFAPEEFMPHLDDDNPWVARHAKLMLQAHSSGNIQQHMNHAVQGFRIGNEFLLLALSHEIVVDYSLRIKKECGIKNHIVAGYSNDVKGYIPSLRVLEEGGYEGRESTIYFAVPTPFTRSVEDTVMSCVHKVLSRLNV